MTTVRTKARIFAAILVCLWVSIALAQQPPTVSKVAILPFTMNAPNDLAYMKDSIRDMLTSRLAWQGKVQVIDRAAVEQAMRGKKTALTPEEAVAIGKGLKADYVLFGAVTAIGKAVSIDAKMVPIKGGAEPVDLFSQANSLDEVIPKINQFAELVNRKAFGRSTDMAQQSTEIDTSATMNPEFLIPQMMMPGGKISYLNPNFLEITPDGAIRQPGLWRSQTFNWGILGMDVGDLDGDGRQELVTVSHDKIIVYQRIEGGLKSVATYQGDKLDRFAWVAVLDANKDGKSEIFVTNLRRHSLPGKQADKGGLTANVDWDPSSLVLSYSSGKLTVVADRLPYFLSTVELSQRGKILIGQSKGSDNAFRSEIFEMQFVGKTLKTLVSLPVPKRCNVFNFAKWDLNGDGSEEVVVIDEENRLLVLNSHGDQLWKSDSRYGATTNLVEAKVVDRNTTRSTTSASVRPF